jgi:class 3 adenylate cyclase/tetratricopeptide (TPR) repeat protein
MNPACPVCGAANAPGARFCSTCGTKLEPTAVARETRKTVTVLFADVTGSTALGEQLDPESLRALMGRYFVAMKGIIEAHGGHVEKFIGDAVMAVFGIPVVHEDDALRAVRAAADIRDRLAQLNTELTATRGQAIRFRTGVNTGEVVAGDPATGQTLVTGDTVNTAARLEQAAPPGEILLGRLTYNLVRDAVEVEPVEPISAKGKTEPVPAYRLVAVRSGAAGHARRLDAPLVGRERELGRLEQALAQAVADRSCQLFTLLGTAGVGKSRLVAEFAASAGPGVGVLHGRCLSYGEGITYWPIGEIVRSAAGIGEADSADAARTKIRSLLDGERDADVLAVRVSAAIGLSAEPAPSEELFWAIRKLFERLAGERPLIIVVEDIHWAEPTLLDLLEYVADWSRDAPLLLLCPARPELLDSRPGWGGGKLNATTLLLEPLGLAAAGQLISALPGGTAIPEAIVERIQAAAEGNPLYVEEFLGMLVDDGLLKQTPDGTWQAAETIDDVRVPPSIAALLAARLERLAPAERAAAERASVVGRIFEEAAVVELTDEVFRSDVGRSLLALVRKELVRPDRSELTAGDAFRFRHILIRDAAYEALPKAERAALHERFADWLERTSGDRLAELEEIVGYHLERAHAYRTELGERDDHVARLAERAVRYLWPAGRIARQRGDTRLALAHFQRARSLTPPASPDLAELLLDIADTHWEFGDAAADLTAIADAEAALPFATERGRHRFALTRADRYVLGAGAEGYQRLRRVSLEVVRATEESGDELTLIRALRSLASADFYTGQQMSGSKVLRRSVELNQAAGRQSAVAYDLATVATQSIVGPSPVSSAKQECLAMLDATSNYPGSRASILLAIGFLEMLDGELESGRARMLEGKNLAYEIGLIMTLGAPNLVGTAEHMVGDPGRAASELAGWLEVLRRARSFGYLASCLPLYAQVLLDTGDLTPVEGLVEEARGLAQIDDIDAQVRWRLALAGLRQREGQVSEAMTLLAEAAALLRNTEWPLLRIEVELAMASAAQDSGDLEGAAAARKRALELATLKEARALILRITGA